MPQVKELVAEEKLREGEDLQELHERLRKADAQRASQQQPAQQQPASQQVRTAADEKQFYDGKTENLRVKLNQQLDKLFKQEQRRSGPGYDWSKDRIEHAALPELKLIQMQMSYLEKLNAVIDRVTDGLERRRSFFLSAPSKKNLNIRDAFNILPLGEKLLLITDSNILSTVRIDQLAEDSSMLIFLHALQATRTPGSTSIKVKSYQDFTAQIEALNQEYSAEERLVSDVRELSALPNRQ